MTGSRSFQHRSMVCMEIGLSRIGLPALFFQSRRAEVTKQGVILLTEQKERGCFPCRVSRCRISARDPQSDSANPELLNTLWEELEPQSRCRACRLLQLPMVARVSPSSRAKANSANKENPLSRSVLVGLFIAYEEIQREEAASRERRRSSNQRKRACPIACSIPRDDIVRARSGGAIPFIHRSNDLGGPFMAIACALLE